MRGFSFLICLFLVTASLSGCATVYNPATGRQERLFISSAEEVQLGRSMDRQVVSGAYQPWNNAMEQRKVNALGQKIAWVSDRKDIVYHFQILDSPDYNAFALPGGYVYIFRGLYEKMDEQETAAVLAHEIGHVAAKHSVKRLQSALGYEALMGLVFLGLGQKDPALAQQLAPVSNTIFDLLSKGYSRQDELFADKLGVKYMKAAGFDPQGMVRSLEFLDKEKGPGGRVFEILSDHPRMAERIKKVKEEIVREKTTHP